MALAAAVPARPAPAAAPPVAVVVAEYYRYVPGDSTGTVPVAAPVVVARGGRVVFANADPAAPHTLTGVGSDGGYLFDTGPVEVQPGEVREVDGVPALEPGTYDFFCKLHSWMMQGRLEVTD